MLEKTKKTFAEIRAFNVAVQGFARRSPSNLSTKLGYALKKVSDGSVSKAVQEYKTAHAESYYANVESVQIDNALTDEKTKAILSAPKDAERPYLYDKEGLKTVISAERQFADVTAHKLLADWDNKEYEIDTYYATELPDDLTEEEVEAFTGFCIKEGQVIPKQEVKTEEVKVDSEQA